MHVLIVGAGLGGLCLAQSLRKQGISFEIFERDTNEQSRFQGWAISIHTIVDELISSFPSDMPDLKESTNHLAPLTLPTQIGLYYPNQGGRLGVQDSPGSPIVRAERHLFRNWLATNLPIQWDKRVMRIEHDDDGVSVYFKDGASAKGDILIGADGINSMTREHLLQAPGSDLLDVVPFAAIIGELNLSGEAFKRQLALAHSAWILVKPDLDVWIFGALHHAFPDGVSGRHYWMFMQPDPDVGKPDHWLRTAPQQEKLDHVLKSVDKLQPKFREIFELTPTDGIKKEPHIWRDLQLNNLPAGRIILVGDAAHAMTPFRGEGRYHAFIDALKLSKMLGQLDVKNTAAVKAAVSEFNAEMLKRGVEAVCNSRNAQMAQKTKDGESVFISAGHVAKPMPEEEIVLEVKN